MEFEGRLTDELASVVAGARRRALRDGDRQIDTAHLLHSLLESDPEVRAVFDGPQIARLLGYLVQRSIGYGLRWQIGVEDAGAVTGMPGTPGWSPVAARAMTQAYERAVRRDEERARGVDLLAAIVAAPASRAVQVLGNARVDAEVLARRIVDGDRGRDGDRGGDVELSARRGAGDGGEPVRGSRPVHDR
ncbi:Clp protease N-terminal domain-containing protein [Streptomyces ipomoeae]|jgi:ATP-dependent Clp protease ATP-binding subunit ClpA|uniref:Clp protease N-terminal domain-containing protein n=1 Tax=Streptomyces ipomoeae TaxID=103232 RepID=UPI0029BB3620|nr:Clp protease N-terminal domain-containing protein [Streptomyces ipomoeae]MDX2827321.1 Clp protease N-terminal domain-containing protein [Streptomyces ipomoeae]MDX2880212.1 Clp protease N-terminal domain-containing protein [Streptomyces ipomoeae]